MYCTLQVEDYDFKDLVADVVALLFAIAAPLELAAIVGHDNGTAIGAFLAQKNGGQAKTPPAHFCISRSFLNPGAHMATKSPTS